MRGISIVSSIGALSTEYTESRVEMRTSFSRVINLSRRDAPMDRENIDRPSHWQKLIAHSRHCDVEIMLFYILMPSLLGLIFWAFTVIEQTDFYLECF